VPLVRECRDTRGGGSPAVWQSVRERLRHAASHVVQQAGGPAGRPLARFRHAARHGGASTLLSRARSLLKHLVARLAHGGGV